MKTLIALTLLAIPAFAIQQPVRTKAGQVSGLPGRNASIAVFKGIPFAQPPVGDLRWHAPVPAKPWTGVKKTERFSDSCVQSIATERKPWTYEFMTHNDVSEDCLYLNVWTAAKTASEKRPVFVYIYGGALTEGSAAVPVYDGEGLAGKGLVVVTINYRLGIWGFFTHPELSKESGHNASGNWGLMDQIAALQWVHDNIAAFGGDPTRVTIAGQSAGASSVHALTASPLAKGLFHRAIADSGSSVTGLGLMNASLLADNEQNGVRFMQSKGAADIKALRAMNVQQILAPVTAPVTAAPAAAPQGFSGGRGGSGRGGAAGRGAGGGGGRFGMVTDGYVLPAPIGEVFAQSKQNDVPTLTGWNADENGASPKPTATLDSYKRSAQQRFADQADLFLKLYPATNDAEAAAMTNLSARDQARTNMYLWAATRGKTAKTKAYTYFWNHVLPGPDAATYGAFHTSEVPYVLNTLYMSERPFVDADKQIADQVSNYWVNFVTTGDPNGKGLPNWPSTTDKPDTTMQIGDNPGAIAIAGDAAKIEFWKQFYQKQMK